MPSEIPATSDGKTLPVDGLMEPLREVLEAVGEAQRRSEAALQTILEGIDAARRVAEAEAPDGEETSDVVAEPAPRVVEVRSPLPEPDDEPEPVQVRIHAPGEEDTADPPSWSQPAPWEAARTDADAPATEPPLGEETLPTEEPTPVTAPALTAPAVSGDARRQVLIALQRSAGELDRLADAEAVESWLWERAVAGGLRVMRLRDKGRSLHAEDAHGFSSFEGERRSRLRKVVVPYDPDGLFAVAASERSIYSGPRPARGLPVDLVLVMGKKSPAWSLVIPLPYRNRWGSFLYVDAEAPQLTEILELEAVARLATLQLRAARYRQHEPADRIRAFRAQTLRDRRRRRKRREAAADPDASKSTGDHGKVVPDEKDSLAQRPSQEVEVPAEEIRQAPDPDRFDASGHLVRPLDGATILSRMGELPPVPEVASRLIRLLSDADTEMAKIQELVSTDAALSVRLLKIANSSLYAHMREASTITEAVLRLGFTAIRSWLMAQVTRTVFLEKGSSVAVHRLWRQSVATALAAQTLGEKTGKMDPDEAFVGGLVQNIGLLLLARNHTEVFEEIEARSREGEVSYYLVERELLGFDHADVGGLVLQRWDLSSSLVNAVASHHRLGTAGGDVEFAAIIALAEDMAERVAEGPTEATNANLLDTPAAQHLGLDQETFDEVEQLLADQLMDRSLFDG